MSDTEFTLPTLHEGLMDEAMTIAYFNDLETSSQLLAVLLKGGSTHHAQDAAPDLAMARAELLERRARGVQIRYLFDDQEWWDTLLWTPQGLRLIRICHDEALQN